MRKLCFGENWRCNGKPVTLPHDAMIAEKRSKDASDGGHGYFPGGVYTYEKTFTAPAEWAGKKVLIEFEGIYRNCTVSLNGKEIGGHKYGYTTFALPLENLNIGGGNTLTVVADNSQIQKANKLSDSDPKNASLIFNIMASLVGSNMNKAANSRRVDAVTAPVLDALDICGYNYASGRYGMDGKLHPDRVILGSETFSFDVCKNWNMMREHPYLVGDFMWTAWDYLGEAGIGAWSYTGGMPFNRPYPWVLGGAGVIDITGKPDGSCRYASTVWGLEKKPRIAVKPVNHPGVRVSKSVWRGTNAMESWAWSGCEGNKAEVEVYSDAAAVELLLGGKSLGKKKIKECKAIFKTRYAPEVLTAVAYGADGEETARSSLSPATGTPHIRLIPEKSSSDIVYIPVEIAGENGVVESNADRKLTVTVEGGELLAFGSANPCTEEQYHTGSFTTYYGRALAVVRVTGSATITVTDGKERVSTEL